jgi:polyhydroxyalkanoate synthesis repressor PhaR
MTIIKRYANRKLYDSLTRRYVTLEEIGWMVQDGEDVTVLDHDSGTDITAVTLTQVIFDQEKRLGGLLPQIVFSRLIKARDASMSILQRGVDTFLDPDQHFNKEILRRLDTLLHEGVFQDLEYNRLTTLLLDRRFEQVEDDSDPPSATTEQLKNLQDQLKDLEVELAAIKQKRQAGPDQQ